MATIMTETFEHVDALLVFALDVLADIDRNEPLADNSGYHNVSIHEDDVRAARMARARIRT